MKRVIFKIATMMASLALVVTTMNVNSACMMLIHQPKLPEDAEKLRRF